MFDEVNIFYAICDLEKQRQEYSWSWLKIATQGIVM